MRLAKIIVEKHADGYVAYPLGLKGVVVAKAAATRKPSQMSNPPSGFISRHLAPGMILCAPTSDPDIGLRPCEVVLLWGNLVSCVPVGNRHARRFPIAAQDAILPHRNRDFPHGLSTGSRKAASSPWFLDEMLLGHAAKKHEDLLCIVLAGRFQLTLIGDSDGLPSGAKNAAAGTPF